MAATLTVVEHCHRSLFYMRPVDLARPAPGETSVSCSLLVTERFVTLLPHVACASQTSRLSTKAHSPPTLTG